VILPQKFANIRLRSEKSHCQMIRAVREILIRNVGLLFSFPFRMNDALMKVALQKQIAIKTRSLGTQPLIVDQ